MLLIVTFLGLLIPWMKCATGTYLQSGVTMENGSGTATLTYVAENITIHRGERFVGNPATLVLPVKPANHADGRSARLAWTALLFLFLSHVCYLFAGAILIVEILRDLPLDSLSYEFRVPILIGTAYVLVLVLLFLELLFFKKTMFGRTRSETIPICSFRGVVFHHTQVISILLNSLVSPFFAGLSPLSLFYMAFGTKVDASVFIEVFGGFDIGDADNTTAMPFAVLDEGSFCVAHRVDQGYLRQGSALLESGATLHPWSALSMGSLGQGSQLFPLSKQLRETHTKDNQVLIGCPAFVAQQSREPRDHSEENSEYEV